MNKTDIEYLDFTWNPLAMRCTPISEGCLNCWHIRRAKMLTGNGKLPMRAQEAWGGGPFWLNHEELLAPVRRKKPARIGVQFMGDLFHEDVSFEQIDLILDVMAHAEQHTFLILTKRPERILDFDKWACLDERSWIPFEHVWYGISAENQQRLDERLPYLLQTPAAKRFVSLEPLLGPIDLSMGLPVETVGGVEMENWIDWVIVGGETGPGARAVAPYWVRALKDQVVSADVPFFFKSWGEYCAPSQMPEDTFQAWDCEHGTEGWDRDRPEWKVGKKRSGREIDGQEWNEVPE